MSDEYLIHYSELEQFAEQHGLNAQEMYQWANAGQDYPQRYLDTHGKANYGTYLKIVEFFASKLHAGTTFGARQDQTAAALRMNIERTKQQEDNNSALFPNGAPGEDSGLAPNGVGRIDDFQGGGSSPSRGISGPYDLNGPTGPAQVRPPEIPGVGHDAPVRSEPAAVRPAGSNS
ncbi:hypothetical protein [Mycobacteroides abscessus]|uniref:hypothetical protein n=1 Tax=Mycobacteroides abscessus TaxID=36809 RepID=UPI0009A83CB3|nr:hypothetical protein [Mycobacteroides abscessus]SLH38977.1 Uncharacterised protein [Mycobacteroides abscessus subsp. massiliense]